MVGAAADHCGGDADRFAHGSSRDGSKRPLPSKSMNSGLVKARAGLPPSPRLPSVRSSRVRLLSSVEVLRVHRPERPRHAVRAAHEHDHPGVAVDASAGCPPRLEARRRGDVGVDDDSLDVKSVPALQHQGRLDVVARHGDAVRALVGHGDGDGVGVDLDPCRTRPTAGSESSRWIVADPPVAGTRLRLAGRKAGDGAVIALECETNERGVAADRASLRTLAASSGVSSSAGAVGRRGDEVARPARLDDRRGVGVRIGVAVLMRPWFSRLNQSPRLASRNSCRLVAIGLDPQLERRVVVVVEVGDRGILADRASGRRRTAVGRGRCRCRRA